MVVTTEELPVGDVLFLGEGPALWPGLKCNESATVVWLLSNLSRGMSLIELGEGGFDGESGALDPILGTIPIERCLSFAPIPVLLGSSTLLVRSGELSESRGPCESANASSSPLSASGGAHRVNS